MDFRREVSISNWSTGLAINIRICYRGAACPRGAGSGIWALILDTNNASSSAWTDGYVINNRICYRGANCSAAISAGVWGLALSSDVSHSSWSIVFYLNIEFVIAVLVAASMIVLVFGL